MHARCRRLRHPARTTRRRARGRRPLAPDRVGNCPRPRRRVRRGHQQHRVRPARHARQYESGLHLQGASGNNQVLDLDSHGNRDPRKNGESADGLAVEEGSGTGNVVRGARLWNNSDDGLDHWMSSSPVLTENSLARGNGFNRWDPPDFTGDGNGLKPGGNGVAADHAVRNTMAWDDAAGGIVDNDNPGRHRIERSTAWGNPKTGFRFDRSTGTLTEDLAAANGTNASLGTTSTGTGNSWDLGGDWSFVSTDPTTITGPRARDGSIPSSTFLRPTNNSDVGARF
ncbi:hypothetical protein ACIGNX_27025 [Actinosynnema sp. NPDC053489]|uniref:right-handed parallel beta-helix repeat-containing protein n=1 Tax=Actinosynnema sp. NPDC053489 TaxID=3363916 RepID=UPI0037C82A50